MIKIHEFKYENPEALRTRLRHLETRHKLGWLPIPEEDRELALLRSLVAPNEECAQSVCGTLRDGLPEDGANAGTCGSGGPPEDFEPPPGWLRQTLEAAGLKCTEDTRLLRSLTWKLGLCAKDVGSANGPPEDEAADFQALDEALAREAERTITGYKREYAAALAARKQMELMQKVAERGYGSKAGGKLPARAREDAEFLRSVEKCRQEFSDAVEAGDKPSAPKQDPPDMRLGSTGALGSGITSPEAAKTGDDAILLALYQAGRLAAANACIGSHRLSRRDPLLPGARSQDVVSDSLAGKWFVLKSNGVWRLWRVADDNGEWLTATTASAKGGDGPETFGQLFQVFDKRRKGMLNLRWFYSSREDALNSLPDDETYLAYTKF